MKNIAILITHGTDTLAWTHAFIRYAIKKNKINIAITGSQKPLPALANFSDAYINIANSVRFMTNIKPPNIFTVFNYGTQAFSDSLYKVDRWNNDAFTGDMIAQMEWDEVKYSDREAVKVFDEPMKLDKLYLLTTGGTIAATFHSANDTLSPIKTSLVEDFIKIQLHDSFDSIEERSVLNIDSSDMTYKKMETIVNKALECMHENGYNETFADFNFDKKVRIVFTDPFKTVSDYEREIDGASAVILAGYGGGNINIEASSDYSPLALVRELSRREIPIVLTSQVAVGPADFIYENAYKAIEIGATSGVNLSIPEIQIRLSYLLGHKMQMEAFATCRKIPFMTLFDHLFMSGMKFRTRKSRKMYEALKNFTPSEADFLVNRTFEDSLAEFEKSGLL